MREKNNFKPKEGVEREEGLAQLDEEAKEADRIRRGAPKEGTVGDNIVVSETDEEARRREADPENVRRQQEQEFLAAPLPDVSDTVQQELARRSAPTDADAFPPEAYEPNYSGMYSGVEDIPDAMDVSSDLNRPEAQVTAPEVDIPMDDDGEPDEGFDVEMDPEDVAAFREASELDPATAAYAALAEEDPELTASFEDAVEANIAQPRVTPELSDADLGPFIEAIFGEGTEATDEIIAQVREILGKEAYRGMTPHRFVSVGISLETHCNSHMYTDDNKKGGMVPVDAPENKGGKVDDGHKMVQHQLTNLQQNAEALLEHMSKCECPHIEEEWVKKDNPSHGLSRFSSRLRFQRSRKRTRQRSRRRT